MFFLLRRRIKFFFQRIFCGFDDSETWSLDLTFYEWLKPRLKRFAKITCAYPWNDKYPTLESWKNELNKRVKQIDMIIKEHYAELKLYDWSYIPEKELKKLQKDPNIMRSNIDMIAFDYLVKDFHKWFADECGWLWW